MGLPGVNPEMLLQMQQMNQQNVSSGLSQLGQYADSLTPAHPAVQQAIQQILQGQHSPEEARALATQLKLQQHLGQLNQPEQGSGLGVSQNANGADPRQPVTYRPSQGGGPVASGPAFSGNANSQVAQTNAQSLPNQALPPVLNRDLPALERFAIPIAQMRRAEAIAAAEDARTQATMGAKASAQDKDIAARKDREELALKTKQGIIDETEAGKNKRAELGSSTKKDIAGQRMDQRAEEFAKSLELKQAYLEHAKQKLAVAKEAVTNTKGDKALATKSIKEASDSLKDVERQLTSASQTMAAAANTPEAKSALAERITNLKAELQDHKDALHAIKVKAAKKFGILSSLDDEDSSVPGAPSADDLAAKIRGRK